MPRKDRMLCIFVACCLGSLIGPVTVSVVICLQITAIQAPVCAAHAGGETRFRGTVEGMYIAALVVSHADAPRSVEAWSTPPPHPLTSMLICIWFLFLVSYFLLGRQSVCRLHLSNFEIWGHGGDARPLLKCCNIYSLYSLDSPVLHCFSHSAVP